MIALVRDLVFRDFALKLFSLVLAVLTWMAINFAIRREVSPLALVSEKRTFQQLPVVIMSSAEDVRNFQVAPKEVDVTIQGDPRILNTLQPKDLHVMVDLTGIEAARDLRKRIEVSTPAGVTHVKVAPEEVQIIFPPHN